MADDESEGDVTTDFTTDATGEEDYEGGEVTETDEAADETVPGPLIQRPKKKRNWVERCADMEKWKCENTPLWNLYMNMFMEDQEELIERDIYKQRKPANLRKFPRLQSEEDLTAHYKCFPLTAFQLRGELKLPNKLPEQKIIRIWKNMRANLPAHPSKSENAIDGSVSKVASENGPGMWPCTMRDLTKELLERRKQKRKKRRDLFPCEPEDIHEIFEESNKDYSDRKELGHARIPQHCPLPTAETLVDCSAGEHYGLVDGEYIIFELPSRTRGTRVYADVCLRGLKGMHLPELGVLRGRQKTWKFCFYPAVIALLAKTQLRYKYAWNANIDYIYDHAWMLYTHIGMINIKDKQRLDDIIVYNYKYSVEVELIQELNDVPIVADIPWDYEERNMMRKVVLQRKELMNFELEIGSEKITDEQDAPVHKGTRKIEEWFDKLKIRYRNCIFRTTRFCVAFWKDNLFWYLYNPYRCDKFGYWDDSGYACIMKFCTKQSLKRHLMILLLRAYVYSAPKPEKDESEVEKLEKDESEGVKPEKDESEVEKPEQSGQEVETPQPEAAQTASVVPSEATEMTLTVEDGQEGVEDEEGTVVTEDTMATETPGVTDEAGGTGQQEAAIEPEGTKEDTEEKFYTIQIFHIRHHCCQIHNLRLLQRGAPKPAKHLVSRKTIDDCPFDPLDVRDPCTIEQEEDDLKEAIEKPTWLKLYKITWAKCMAAPQKKKSTKETGMGKMRWHQYVVEESNKLFSLWGEIHITDGMFERENRGMQTYACYVVCAGMTRIMAPEYWSSKILDVIVMCGDRYYTYSKLEADFKSTKNEYSHVNCWNRYLMSHFNIGETMFEAKVLPAICGRLYSKSSKYLWQSLEQLFLKYQFGILTCESSCLGIFKFCGAYYMCDVNSFGPPLFTYGEGVVYLFRATYFYKFITVLVLTIGSPECSQFALNPIEILKVMDVGPSVFPVGVVDKKDRSKRVSKVECPYDEEKKRHMKKWKHKRTETAKTIDKLCCKGQ